MLLPQWKTCVCVCVWINFVSHSSVSAVSDSSGSPGWQCLPAAAPGANSRGQQRRRSLKDHSHSSNRFHTVIGSVALSSAHSLLKHKSHLSSVTYKLADIPACFENIVTNGIFCPLNLANHPLQVPTLQSASAAPLSSPSTPTFFLLSSKVQQGVITDQLQKTWPKL